MITASDALVVARTRDLGLTTPEPKLTEREQTQLDYLDASIEANIYKVYAGGIFATAIPGDLVEPHVLEALRLRYEEGGWQLAVFPVRAGDTVAEYQVIFAPGKPTGGEPSKLFERPDKALPAVARQMYPEAASRGDGGGWLNFTRLLVRMPTRGRPAQALNVLARYRALASMPFAIEVIIDEDDETMQSAEVLQRLAALGCVVTTGRHRSKVEACNGGRLHDWDVLMLASDDMVPVAEGWAVRVVEEMERCWPHLDGAIFFNDGYQRGNLCTLPIFGRRLYDQFHYVYQPTYQSLFCDREQTDLLKEMGRLTYVDEKIIEHRHHVWGRAEKDATYERNDALESADKAVYDERKTHRRPGAQWTFGAPPMWLSILICSVPARRQQVDRLLGDLWRQIDVYHRRSVEICVDAREGISIGDKRQALLERAKGHFVAFIDDDDGVSHDYVDRVLKAIRFDPETDCASLVGSMTTAGVHPERFEHSIKHDGWFTKGGVHYRTPNHLNAVRRELALQVGFVSLNHGEDHDFSKRLRPLIKREVSTGDAPLYFYWFWPK